MKLNHWIIPIVLGVVACFGFNYLTVEGVAYVNLHEVFDQFEMKKELQKDFDTRVSAEQKIIDESRMAVATLKLRWESDRQNMALYDSLTTFWQMSELQEKERENSIALMTEEFDAQIHDQMQQYLDDFGKNKKVKILLGVMDNGTILHSANGVDLTKEAIEYVNEKYLDK
jgi:Skp family chaperone for outer membrane proteins